MAVKGGWRPYLLLALAAAGILLMVLSIVPFNRVALGTRPWPGSSQRVAERAAEVHVAVHVLIFAGLTVGVWLGFTSMAKRLAGLAAVFLLGYGTEYLQHVVYGHPIERLDVGTDLVTAAVTFGVAYSAFAVRRRRKGPRLK